MRRNEIIFVAVGFQLFGTKLSGRSEFIKPAGAQPGFELQAWPSVELHNLSAFSIRERKTTAALYTSAISRAVIS
jgi:hypothetical protein